MNAFQLTLSIDQDFLEKIELGLAENVIDLVSTRTSKLRGSLEIEATQQNFSNLTNEKSAKSVKRKANTPNADHVEKVSLLFSVVICYGRKIIPSVS